MRLILSRKGFDATVGQVASPILENDHLFSLPIPERAGSVHYAELTPRGVRVSELLADLQPDVLSRCHLDPDLDGTSLPRARQWRPAFGQADAAACHLDRQGVSAGDLFLFFGWFRRVECVTGRWRYVRGAPDLHVLWGWLRVGTVVWPLQDSCPPGLAGHPHFDGRQRRQNRIYVAKLATDGGVFARLSPELILTAAGYSRSWWRLPRPFLPAGRYPLTYHGHGGRWLDEGASSCLLHSVGRGQEFVLDCAQYPEVWRWAEELIERAG